MSSNVFVNSIEIDYPYKTFIIKVIIVNVKPYYLIVYRVVPDSFVCSNSFHQLVKKLFR